MTDRGILQRGKRILLVTAHPDDESYVFGGTVFRNAMRGGTTALVCATSGERGTSHLPKALAPALMKRLRGRELRKAARMLRIASVTIGNIPDGRVARYPQQFFQTSLRSAQRFRPAVVMSFSADGITGHRDHLAAGKVARRLSRALRVPLLAATLPPAIQRGALQWLATRRRHGHYAARIRFAKPTLRIPIDAAAKQRAIRCHRSQMDGKQAFTGYPAYAVRELLRAEYYVVGPHS